MRGKSESLALLTVALDAANVQEADAVLISTDRNISRFANSTVHQNMSELTAELTLRVVANGAIGVASTSVLDRDEIARTAEVAREAARYSNPLPQFGGLYRGGEPVPQVRTFDEPTARIPPAEKAQALRRMFDDGRARNVHFAGAYTTGAMSVACGNTHGVRRYCRATSADATVIAIAAEGSGYATRCARSAREVDVEALGREATEKATLQSHSIRDLEPGAYDVILEPPAIAEVLDWMNMITFSGQSYEDGSSFFVGKIGETMFDSSFTLADDSVDESFLPFPFDIEGLPKRRVALIERGVVRTPVVDKAWSDRLGIPPTASAWHLGSPEHGAAFHLAVEGGNATREELLASTKRGIWVTRFNYVNGLLEPRSALMTGTTRDGTFLVENGEVVARLPNLRWTQSMVDAFANIEGLTAERRAVGTWYNPFGGTLAPTMKIRGWNITGKSVARG
jgi:PmbA protein